MAWMASYLFVQSTEHEKLVAALTALLEDTAHRADQEGILDTPPPLLISPEHQEWMAVVGVSAWIDDVAWAGERISLDCSTRVVSCTILGNCYRLRLETHEHGQSTSLHLLPATGWLHQGQETIVMPQYQDVERLAYQSLLGQKIPAALVIIGTAPVGYPKTPPMSIGQGTQLCLQEGTVMRSQLELRLYPFQGDDPPVLPTGVSHDFGLMVFETRYLEGRPNRQALEQILAIEEEIQARIQRLQPDKNVTLTMTYHAGPYQEEVDVFMQKLGHSTAAHTERGMRRPAWWQFWRHFGRL